MIIDSSAVIAILRDEPDALAYATAIERVEHRRISAVSYVESAAIADRHRDPVVGRKFDAILREAHVVVEPVTEAQAQVAREAYRDFGKGSGHPAQLNLGDCFSYALAKVQGEPLLFKGNDFAKTDVAVAVV